MKLSDRAVKWLLTYYNIDAYHPNALDQYCWQVHQLGLQTADAPTLELLTTFCESRIEHLAAMPEPQTWTDPRTNCSYRVVSGALQVRDDAGDGAWCPAPYMPVVGREAINALFEPLAVADPFDTLRQWGGSKLVSSSDFDEGAVNREALIAAYDAARR